MGKIVYLCIPITNTNTKKMKKTLLLGMFLSLFLTANAEVDPNFYIYLCFGQSNMEGNASPQSIDKSFVDERFQTLACVDFADPARNMGEWYTAYPPIVRQGTGLGMADYFGRTMVAALPSNIKVGVVDVAIGGTSIKGFYSELVADYIKNEADWFKAIMAAYDNDPYKRLVDMAKIAQQSGVIKGILLHQGCTDCNNSNWPNMVKTIYERLLNDLGLNAADVPLFVGETEREDMGGGCSSHNNQVGRMPQVVPTSYVVSSEGIPGNGADAWHFSAAGYRIFGKRYAFEALKVMGHEIKKDAEYELPTNLEKFFTPKKFDDKMTVAANKRTPLKLYCTFKDNHKEDLTIEAKFTSEDLTIKSGKVKLEEGTGGIVKATWTDFLGEEHVVDILVATEGYTGIQTVKSKKANSIVYDLRGIKKGTSEQWEELPHGAYVVDGKLIVK